MADREVQKKRLALVLGTLPVTEEVDQLGLIADGFDTTVISSESICGYLAQTSRLDNLKCISCPDHDENATYLPGLESILGGFDVVVVKERLGLYAYQVMKAKWRHQFRLVIWVDNLTPFAGEDVMQMRTIRREVTAAADAFIVQTDAAHEALLTEGVSEEKIHKFRPWVQSNVKRNGRNKAKALEALRLHDGDFVVAHVGQIEWEESLFDLLQGAKIAMNRDQSLGDRLRIVICGVGSLAEQLNQRAIALGMRHRITYLKPNRDAFDTIAAGADCLFYGSVPSRDRVEGEPYRLMMAMANEIPIVACRGPLVEELIGKHRIDFCPGSTESVATALIKLSQAAALRHDIAKKNAAEVARRFSRDVVAAEMNGVLSKIADVAPAFDNRTLDHQVREVEEMVRSKRFVDAARAIETVIGHRDLAVHHRANLHRLMGDSFAKLGDLDTAKNAYLQAIEQDPFLAKAHIGLGTVALLKNSFDVAIHRFQRSVSLSPEDEMASLGLGLAFQGIKELNEANKWVLKSLQLNPTNTAGLFTIVQLAYDRNQFNDAENAVRGYLARNPQDNDMRFTLAGLLYKMERFDEALSVAEAIVTSDPLHANARSLVGQIRMATTPEAVSSSSK